MMRGSTTSSSPCSPPRARSEARASGGERPGSGRGALRRPVLPRQSSPRSQPSELEGPGPPAGEDVELAARSFRRRRLSSEATGSAAHGTPVSGVGLVAGLRIRPAPKFRGSRRVPFRRHAPARGSYSSTPVLRTTATRVLSMIDFQRKGAARCHFSPPSDGDPIDPQIIATGALDRRFAGSDSRVLNSRRIVLRATQAPWLPFDAPRSHTSVYSRCVFTMCVRTYLRAVKAGSSPSREALTCSSDGLSNGRGFGRRRSDGVPLSQRVTWPELPNRAAATRPGIGEIPATNTGQAILCLCGALGEVPRPATWRWGARGSGVPRETCLGRRRQMIGGGLRTLVADPVSNCATGGRRSGWRRMIDPTPPGATGARGAMFHVKRRGLCARGSAAYQRGRLARPPLARGNLSGTGSRLRITE